MNLLEHLKTILGEDGVLDSEAASERSAGVWGDPGPIQARALVRPKSTQEVSAVLKLCHEAGQTVVPHGGLSTVVEGAHSTLDDLVLSLERMDQIEDIDVVGRTMTVQAGAILETIQEKAAEAGLLFPLDLGARGSCTIGGNVATNAGGNRVIRYGMTRQLVLGLEVVLPDGTILSSMNRMIKNNAGFDLKQLFIGSEGLLGVVTRVVIRLMEQPSSWNTAFVALNDFHSVTRLLKFMDAGLGGGLSAFEVMWRDFYQLVTTPPANSKPPIPYHYPFYVLVECMGADQTRDGALFQNVLQSAMEEGLVEDAVISQTKAQTRQLWHMRDDVSQIFQFKPVFLFDVSLPIKDMEQYTIQLRQSLDAWNPENQCFIFGHLGDGNLHIMVHGGTEGPETRKAVESMIYQPLQPLGGSVSAEHGVGLEKKPWLSMSRNPAELALMKTLKRTMDPKGILNPGKVFD